MANKKITELAELTALTDDDLLLVVNNPGDIPVTNKITKANALAGVLREDTPANKVAFDTTPTVTPDIGQLYWDETEGTLAVKLTADVTLAIGTENFLRVVNKTGSTIPDGSVVYINGAQGNRPTVALAIASSVDTSMVLGVATHDILDNAEGFITISGDVHNFDTSQFSVGDILYLSASSAGTLTSTPPSSPHNVVVVATSLNDTINGVITVHQNHPISANTALGTSNVVAPTQAAVKSYVDTAVTNAGGGDMTKAVYDPANGNRQVAFGDQIPDQLSDLTADSTHRTVTDAEKSTWNGKQDALGFTPENVANKDTDVLLGASDTKYPSQKATKTYADTKKYYHGVESIGTYSFDNTTHILSLTSVTYWYQGVKYTTASAVNCDLDSFVTLTANTLYYVYFDDATGTLKASASSWNLKTMVTVATVFWNGTAGAVGKEPHNHTRDIDWHTNAHFTIGTRYGSGLSVTNPTTTNDALLQIESGSIYDEDIILAISQQTNMRGFYKVNASTYTFADYSLPYLGSSGQPQYLDTDTYALTNVGASDYTVMWVYATNDNLRPIYVIPTHASAAYNTISASREELAPDLSLIPFAPEMKLIYKFIYKGDGQFQELVDYRNSSSLPAGGTPSSSAAGVTFAPTGNISSTNVQSAIAELDTEKAPAANGVTNGDTHDHSGGDGAQINHTTISNIGTNTHAQIDTHIASTSNPHSVTKTQVGLANVSNDAQLPLAGGTMSGSVAMGNNNITGVKQVTFNGVVDNGNSGTSKTIDWTAGSVQKITMTGDCTFTFTAPTGVSRITLKLINDGTARAITWPAGVKWSSGTAPTLTGTNGKYDVVTFMYMDSEYLGMVGSNF